jgi:hypothetical protein
MSYNALHIVRACMLASIAGVGVAYSSGQAAAQVDPGPRALTAAEIAFNTQPKTAPSLSSEGVATFDSPTSNFFPASYAAFPGG